MYDSWVFVLSVFTSVPLKDRVPVSKSKSWMVWKKTVPQRSHVWTLIADILFVCVGFSIELLQTTFQKNFKPATPDPELPLGKYKKKNNCNAALIFRFLWFSGQKALIGQVTLRCSDIDKSLAFYTGILGMKLLSIQVPQISSVFYKPGSVINI
jgi:hypothetical protein